MTSLVGALLLLPLPAQGDPGATLEDEPAVVPAVVSWENGRIPRPRNVAGRIERYEVEGVAVRPGVSLKENPLHLGVVRTMTRRFDAEGVDPEAEQLAADFRSLAGRGPRGPVVPLYLFIDARDERGLLRPTGGRTLFEFSQEAYDRVRDHVLEQRTLRVQRQAQQAREREERSQAIRDRRAKEKAERTAREEAQAMRLRDRELGKRLLRGEMPPKAFRTYSIVQITLGLLLAMLGLLIGEWVERGLRKNSTIDRPEVPDALEEEGTLPATTYSMRQLARAGLMIVVQSTAHPLIGVLALPVLKDFLSGESFQTIAWGLLAVLFVYQFAATSLAIWWRLGERGAAIARRAFVVTLTTMLVPRLCLTLLLVTLAGQVK